jgi:hypothetical protein
MPDSQSGVLPLHYDHHGCGTPTTSQVYHENREPTTAQRLLRVILLRDARPRALLHKAA